MRGMWVHSVRTKWGEELWASRLSWGQSLR